MQNGDVAIGGQCKTEIVAIGGQCKTGTVDRNCILCRRIHLLPCSLTTIITLMIQISDLVECS